MQQMDKMLGEEDPKPGEMEKKSEKSKKDEANDLLDVNRARDIEHGKHDVEVDGGLPKEKVQRERSPKRKSTSNEDWYEGEHEKGSLDGDGDLQEEDKNKSERYLSEDNHPTEKAQRELKKQARRVSFSSHVEVFPSTDIDYEQPKTPEDDLVQGKRFTKEEDEIIKGAVLDYIKRHDLGEGGVEKVMNSRSNGLKDCWKEIATCIPYRPYSAVYYRAHILFERSEERKWTREELDALLEFVKRHGKKWKMAAQEFGNSKVHVKDAYRRPRHRGEVD